MIECGNRLPSGRCNVSLEFEECNPGCPFFTEKTMDFEDHYLCLHFNLCKEKEKGEVARQTFYSLLALDRVSFLLIFGTDKWPTYRKKVNRYRAMHLMTLEDRDD